jgi:hypothetical protein
MIGLKYKDKPAEYIFNENLRPKQEEISDEKSHVLVRTVLDFSYFNQT